MDEERGVSCTREEVGDIKMKRKGVKVKGRYKGWGRDDDRSVSGVEYVR